jgi:hypothetical protein
MDSYGILVVPIGSDISDWQHVPAKLRPLLPDASPDGPVLIDLAALRAHAGAVLDAAPDASREDIRSLLFGFDAIVVLPGSSPATWRVTGFPPP